MTNRDEIQEAPWSVFLARPLRISGRTRRGFRAQSRPIQISSSETYKGMEFGGGGIAQVGGGSEWISVRHGLLGVVGVSCGSSFMRVSCFLLGYWGLGVDFGFVFYLRVMISRAPHFRANSSPSRAQTSNHIPPLLVAWNASTQ